MRVVTDTSHTTEGRNFPSFSEGLSLREITVPRLAESAEFPFLFGGTFIEGPYVSRLSKAITIFPFLFGGTFIEGERKERRRALRQDFPSFSEGLSLRAVG